MKLSISILFSLLIMSSGCRQGSQSHPQINTDSVRPILDGALNSDGNQPTSSSTSQAAASGVAGVPDTPLQKMLAAQISNSETPLNLGGDDALLPLPPLLKSHLNVENLRAVVFDRINKERAAAGVKPVLYDRLAERAATLHVLEQLDSKHWLSHYSLNGDLPYMRFSRINGFDYEEENAASMNILSNGLSRSDDDTTLCTGVKTWPVPDESNVANIAARMVTGLECAMVSEKAPNDGHKKTILNPHATSVGISVGAGIWDVTDSKGVKSSRLVVFLMEEFATRGLTEVSPIPLSVSLKLNPKVAFSGKFSSEYQFDSARLYFEQLKLRTPDEAGNDYHYSFPNMYQMLMPPPKPGTTWVPTKGTDGPIKSIVQVSDKVFTLPIPFEKGPGIYTFCIIAKRTDNGSAVAVANRSIYVLP